MVFLTDLSDLYVMKNPIVTNITIDSITSSSQQYLTLVTS